MKIQVPLPEHLASHWARLHWLSKSDNYKNSDFVQEILLWAEELGIQAEFYSKKVQGAGPISAIRSCLGSFS